MIGSTCEVKAQESPSIMSSDFVKASLKVRNVARPATSPGSASEDFWSKNEGSTVISSSGNSVVHKQNQGRKPVSNSFKSDGVVNTSESVNSNPYQLWSRCATPMNSKLGKRGRSYQSQVFAPNDALQPAELWSSDFNRSSFQARKNFNATKTTSSNAFTPPEENLTKKLVSKTYSSSIFS